jgi:preprotein translocase subunit SecG
VALQEPHTHRQGVGGWSRGRWLALAAVVIAIAVVVLLVLYAGGGSGGGGGGGYQEGLAKNRLSRRRMLLAR